MWTESGWCFQAVETLLIISHLSEESNRKHGRLCPWSSVTGYVEGLVKKNRTWCVFARVSWVTVNTRRRLDRSFTQSWERRRSPSHPLQGHEERQAVLLSLSSTSSVCFETTPMRTQAEMTQYSGYSGYLARADERQIAEQSRFLDSRHNWYNISHIEKNVFMFSDIRWFTVLLKIVTDIQIWLT